MPGSIFPDPPKKKEELIDWARDFNRAVFDLSRQVSTKVSYLHKNRYPKIGPVFTSGDATPSVKDFSLFKTNNAAPTTITNFDDYSPEHYITVIAGDSNTTIAHNASIKLLKGVSMLMTVDKTASFVIYGGVWYQVGGQDV